MSQELQEDEAHPQMVLETHKQTKQERKMVRNTLWLIVFVKRECVDFWMLGLDLETQGIEGKKQGIEGKT